MISPADLKSLEALRDCDKGPAAIIFVGDWRWRKGPRLNAILAFLFGPRQVFVHLGMRATVAWYREQPYLVGFHPVEAGPHTEVVQ